MVRSTKRYVGQQLMNLIRTVRASDAYSNMHPMERAGISNAMNMAGQQYTMRRGIKQRYLPRGYVEARRPTRWRPTANGPG